MVSRKEVYAAIDSERAYQKARWGVAGVDNPNSVGQFVTILSEYADLARSEWVHKVGDGPALEVIRKIAGVAVSCMEQNGAPQRVGFEQFFENK